MKKHFFKILLIGIVLSINFSCNNDDDNTGLEGKTPTERYNEQVSELQQALQSSENGWKMTFFTDDPRYTENDQQLGGWTFIMKFTNDKHVNMISDFSEETLTPKESIYEIKIGSTIKLSFATKNWISMLTDSGNYPTGSLSGYGYTGDNEFLYYGKEGEDLIFRSNREQIEIHFQPATENDWNNLEQSLHTLESLTDAGNLQVEIKNNEEITTYNNFSFNTSARFATNFELDSLSFGIAPMPNGIRVIKPITVGNQKAIDFTYDSTNNWFISELENGDYAKIILGEPIPTSDIVNDYYFAHLLFSGSPAINDSSDPYLDAYVEARDSIEQETGLTFYGFFMLPTYGLIEYIFLDEDGNDIRPVRIISNYSVDDSTQTLTLEDGGWYDTQGLNIGNSLDPIHEIIFNSNGLKVFRTGSLYEGDPVFQLIDNENPVIQIGTYGLSF